MAFTTEGFPKKPLRRCCQVKTFSLLVLTQIAGLCAPLWFSCWAYKILSSPIWQTENVYSEAVVQTLKSPIGVCECIILACVLTL